MSFEEVPLSFDCRGETLIGIAVIPTNASVRTGLLVIVGGPQYRAGSHRQFVLLCRALAEQGIPAMRFDCRGMGDSSGSQRSFEHFEEDIRAAIDAFLREATQVTSVALWGLCDGASAACFYAPTDHRVSALALLNPWVRTESGEAKTYVKHYYANRIIDAAFWRKLLSGELRVAASIADLLKKLRMSAKSNSSRAATDLPSRMAKALKESGLPMLFVLSGNDYVAKEFEYVAASKSTWTEVLQSADVMRLESADHTFSKSADRIRVEKATIDWLTKLSQSADK